MLVDEDQAKSKGDWKSETNSVTTREGSGVEPGECALERLHQKNTGSNGESGPYHPLVILLDSAPPGM